MPRTSLSPATLPSSDEEFWQRIRCTLDYSPHHHHHHHHHYHHHHHHHHHHLHHHHHHGGGGTTSTTSTTTSTPTPTLPPPPPKPQTASKEFKNHYNHHLSMAHPPPPPTPPFHGPPPPPRCILGDQRLVEETSKAFKKDKKLIKGDLEAGVSKTLDFVLKFVFLKLFFNLHNCYLLVTPVPQESPSPPASP